MEKRQIRMQDGRYLIFYTFTDGPAPPKTEGQGVASADDRQADAKPEAEEERRV
ncbi:MAG TPA: hypothetical protein VJT09_00050 [Pyrinomonadaceae bacterium]|nr:hypothetical protein [Pyrinomonadaceae bacterium]